MSKKTKLIEEHGAAEAENDSLEEDTDEEPEERPLKVYNAIPDPPEIVDVSERFVLFKIHDFHLRHRETPNLTLAKVNPPLVPPVERDPALEPKVYPKRANKNFVFPDFTFCMESSMVVTDTFDGTNFKHCLHANFSILVDEKIHLLCVRYNKKGVEIVLDPMVDGSEWRLHGLGKDDFLVESAQLRGWCLAVTCHGLTVEPITPRQWSLLDTGVCDPRRRVTITDIPDFAITAPGVSIF